LNTENSNTINYLFPFRSSDREESLGFQLSQGKEHLRIHIIKAKDI